VNSRARFVQRHPRGGVTPAPNKFDEKFWDGPGSLRDRPSRHVSPSGQLTPTMGSRRAAGASSGTTGARGATGSIDA
jgi:hypothetical protein